MPTPIFLKSAYVVKTGSTDSSDISTCAVVLLEEEEACIEIERDRRIAVESALPCQVTGTLRVDQIEI